MKFSLSWLKDHLDTTADVTEIAETLTAIGLEVETIHNPAEGLDAFIVAEVVEAAPHPNADRLQLLKVDIGAENTVQVVCGAPNARAGLKGVFAPVGTQIPSNGMVLKPTKIRGVDSQGMLCSARELMLGNDHDGIIELAADASVGRRFMDEQQLDDPVIEIAITPNHQDALGVYGIARDLAAAGLGQLKEKEIIAVPGHGPCSQKVTLAADACPVFGGRLITGLENRPSPAWLCRKLEAVGLQPRSALVDITNFLTHDQARPLHVYDADRLQGDIVVRPARDDETFSALDGEDYHLPAGACVIADDSGPIGLGGIIGGEGTGCTMATTAVFLESAWFNPIAIAEAGRKLGIDSDARYRFERGVDPEMLRPGLEMATRLILDLCGGEASDISLVGQIPDGTKTIALRPARVKVLGGVTIAPDRMIDILRRLGFRVARVSDSRFDVTCPSWRCDVDGEADLVEEILRIHGFTHIPAVPLPAASQPLAVGPTPLQKRASLARRAAAAQGLREAVTWSFMSTDKAALFAPTDSKLILENPISRDLDCMRPNLLPNLMMAAKRNIDRGFKNLGIFESANQFFTEESSPPAHPRPILAGQALVLAGLRCGQTGGKHWQIPPRDGDVFTARADVEAILRALGARVDGAQIVSEAPAWYHPGRSGTVRLGPKNILAYFGEIHPTFAKAFAIKGPLVGFEILLENIPFTKTKNNRGPLKASDFQAIERDFAFVVDQEVTAQALIKAVRSADRTRITDVILFDVYEGAGIEEGRKSLAVTVRLQPESATLTEQDIMLFSEKVISNVHKATGGVLRE